MRFSAFFCIPVALLGCITLFFSVFSTASFTTIALPSPTALAHIKKITATATDYFFQKNIFHVSVIEIIRKACFNQKVWMTSVSRSYLLRSEGVNFGPFHFLSANFQKKACTIGNDFTLVASNVGLPLMYRKNKVSVKVYD